MRKLLSIIVVLALVYFALDESGLVNEFRGGGTDSASAIAQAFERRQSGVLVEGNGEVIRVLSDDVDGDRHQRFVLRLGSGRTLLIAHNIDLAPRLPRLKEGDVVEFFGEYEWNDQGGVVHWTHKDPQGRHPAGWLKHAGRTYQ
jgi:hypothetical protein